MNPDGCGRSIQGEKMTQVDLSDACGLFVIMSTCVKMGKFVFSA